MLTCRPDKASLNPASLRSLKSSSSQHLAHDAAPLRAYFATVCRPSIATRKGLPPALARRRCSQMLTDSPTGRRSYCWPTRPSPACISRAWSTTRSSCRRDRRCYARVSIGTATYSSVAAAPPLNRSACGQDVSPEVQDAAFHAPEFAHVHHRGKALAPGGYAGRRRQRRLAHRGHCTIVFTVHLRPRAVHALASTVSAVSNDPTTMNDAVPASAACPPRGPPAACPCAPGPSPR